MTVVSGSLSFIIVAIVVAVIGWSFVSKKIGEPGPLSADKTVNIPKGDDVEVTLEENGVIASATLMKAALFAERNSGSVKAGEYVFKQGASLQDVIDTLVSGKQVLHALTIPEGLTSFQVVERMRENDVLVGDVKTIPPEGSLMPDTFKFFRGMTREQLIKTMQQQERKVVTDVWARRSPDTVIRSPYELVTLASIVEKETGKPDERPRVAGVFSNRLSRNMPLQSDPTTVYGLVGGKGTLGRGLLRSELDQKTPYNTYTIVGLPPGPIANPGKAALEAVANPVRSKDLYFVADGTGGHVFAETLEQHNANVARYRQIEKDAKDRLSPDAGKGLAPTPATPASSRSQQRGDLGGAQDYGTLGQLGSIDAPAATNVQPSRFAGAPLSFDDAYAYKPPAVTEQKGQRASAGAAGSSSFDDLDIEVDGVRSKDVSAYADQGAGQPDRGEAGNLLTFPVSPERQAAMRARAAEYGLPQPDSALPPRTAQASIEAPAAPLAPGKTRIYDASEGTALDPLRDRTYDLNSAKSVPAIKVLPPFPTSRLN